MAASPVTPSTGGGRHHADSPLDDPDYVDVGMVQRMSTASLPRRRREESVVARGPDEPVHLQLYDTTDFKFDYEYIPSVRESWAKVRGRCGLRGYR